MRPPGDALLNDVLDEMVMTITVTRNMWTLLRVKVGLWIMCLGARITGMSVMIKKE